MPKERSDFVRVKAKGPRVTVCGPNYEYAFDEGAAGLELLRADWLGPRFDTAREHLEVSEDPVIIPDPVPTGSPRAKPRGDKSEEAN